LSRIGVFTAEGEMAQRRLGKKREEEKNLPDLG
jgi:hypothetical protein